MVQLDKQVFHSLHVRLFHIELDLQRLASFVDTFILGLLQNVKLSEMTLLNFHLLFAQLLHAFRKLSNSLVLVTDLLLQFVSLALEHVDLSAALLRLANCSNCPCLLFVKHATKFASFRLASLFFLFIELF